ncbi:MAG: tetratricopeptide (TPR) repeat protein [Gammaproteobacteria bacterium]|jgi:tetratricopeptide (TPR) repeat protein
MSAIGLSYLSEALSIHRQLISSGAIDQVDFYYPLLLEVSAGVQEPLAESQKRSGLTAHTKKLRQTLKTNLQQSMEFLEKAIRLDPDHKPSYLSLAIAHLIDGNPYLVRGVLQGLYLPRFGQNINDSAPVTLLLAMTHSQQGDHLQAERLLKKVVTQKLVDSSEPVLPQDLLLFSAIYNLAALYRYQQQVGKITPLWQALAHKAQASGNAVLFRMAFKHLSTADQKANQALTKAPSIKGVRIGDKKPRDDTPHHVSELWIEGEQYHVYVYEDGARYISASNGKVVSASQVGGLANIEGLIEIGGGADRPLKALGLPDRRIHLSTGEYIAYDDYRLVLHIDDNRVLGWFLYP